MVTLWNPFQEIDRLHREINRLFNAPDHDGSFSRTSFLPGRAARSYPLLNLTEQADGYEAVALAPGVAPDSIKVSVANNQLVIEGEKIAADGEIKSESYHRSERSAGKFVRSITLPCDLDATRVEAEYRNGLLRVKLPKAESAKPRQIAVNFN